MKELKTIVYNKALLRITAVDIDNEAISYTIDEFTEANQVKLLYFLDTVISKYKVDSNLTVVLGCAQIKNADGERVVIDYVDSNKHTLIYLDTPNQNVSSDINIVEFSTEDKVLYLENKQIVIDKLKED